MKEVVIIIVTCLNEVIYLFSCLLLPLRGLPLTSPPPPPLFPIPYRTLHLSKHQHTRIRYRDKGAEDLVTLVSELRVTRRLQVLQEISRQQTRRRLEKKLLLHAAASADSDSNRRYRHKRRLVS